MLELRVGSGRTSADQVVTSGDPQVTGFEEENS
jgi:hypothetical protein